MTTNVTPPEFTATGLVLPEPSAVLAGVISDYDDALGGGVNPALNTPQGQLASSTTDIITDNNALFAEFVNQVNPDTATGFMQDAIARIYFIERTPGAPTAVTCQCMGADGTVIPIGAQAADTSGNRYVATSAGTIASGTVTITFANILDGPTACPADTLTSIYQSINGWDSVNNDDPGTVGRDVETQADFAFRRQMSVALNAHGSLPSIQGAVFEVADVLDVYVTENVTAGVVDAGETDYPLAPHSLYVAVVGGVSQDIGEAIWSKKDVGCNYNGNTTVTVTDSAGYSLPYPSYEVTFERPDALPVLFAVVVKMVPGLPATLVADIKSAIIDAFTGVDPLAVRARIGAEVLASTFYGPVIRAVPTAPIVSILIGTVTADATSVLVGIDQVPTLDEADISVSLI